MRHDPVWIGAVALMVRKIWRTVHKLPGMVRKFQSMVHKLPGMVRKKGESSGRVGADCP